MKNKRNVISIAAVLVLAAVITCLVFYRNGKKSQTVVVIKDSNVESYETAFGTNLQEGTQAAADRLTAKDVTDSSLNNAYRDDQMIKERCFLGLALLSLKKKADIDFGAVYQIPAVYMAKGSALLLANEKKQPFIVEEECVRVNLSFDVTGKKVASDKIQAGVRQDGNYLNIELDTDGEGHFEGNLWLFRGNTFYPYIENADGQEIIITNADVTVVRDDTVKLGEQ